MKSLPLIRYLLAAMAVAALGALSLFSEIPSEGKLTYAPRPKPSPKLPPPPPPRVKVLIDAGHGGQDGGATRAGVLEKNVALSISKKLERRLRKEGVVCAMTRSTDVYLSLDQRVAMAEEKNPVVLCSVHCNTGPPGSRGLEVYYGTGVTLRRDKKLRAELKVPADVPIEDDRSKILAEMILRDLSRDTGTRARKAVPRDLALTSRPSCPSVLVECGYLTDPQERLRLNDNSFQEKIAESLCQTLRTCVDGLSKNKAWNVRVILPEPSQ